MPAPSRARNEGLALSPTKAALPIMAFVLGLALWAPCRAGDLVRGDRRVEAASARVDVTAGCGDYGTHDCQFVPRLGGDGRPGPVYEGGPRCGWRWTPLGSRRLCRAY